MNRYIIEPYDIWFYVLSSDGERWDSLARFPSATAAAEYIRFLRSRMEPEGEGEKPLDKLQRLGQEYEAAPEEQPGARAKVGDWVCSRSCRARLVQWWPYGIFEAETSDGKTTFIRPDEIIAILPAPPRHGDFGSRPEEDGA